MAHRIDDLASPRLPLRLANRLGDPLARRSVRLDEEGLLAAARRRTGLDDFGDPRFREPFRVLLGALEAEADLSAVGRLGLDDVLVSEF